MSTGYVCVCVCVCVYVCVEYLEYGDTQERHAQVTRTLVCVYVCVCVRACTQDGRPSHSSSVLPTEFSGFFFQHGRVKSKALPVYSHTHIHTYTQTHIHT